MLAVPSGTFLEKDQIWLDFFISQRFRCTDCTHSVRKIELHFHVSKRSPDGPFKTDHYHLKRSKIPYRGVPFVLNKKTIQFNNSICLLIKYGFVEMRRDVDLVGTWSDHLKMNVQFSFIFPQTSMTASSL